jgi:ornithine cyclodeaminase/alanine dehydrogenase-like protein (mu-crystallin family)
MEAATPSPKSNPIQAPLWVDAERLRTAMSMGDAVSALESGFADELPITPQRMVVERGAEQLILMPAAGAMGSGVKLVTLQSENPGRGLPLIQGVYALFAAETLSPLAFFDGAELTRLRTPAVSALATKYMARPDARRLLVFGAGVQARAHVEAMQSVRAIDHVTIVDPAQAPAQALVEDLRAQGIEAEVGTAEQIGSAEIVCTCTTSPTPLFDGEWLAPGTHINAMGSYQPHTREIDSATCARSRIAVESREAVMAEAGDLLLAIGEGVIAEGDVIAELAELARGARVREDDEQITLFKSVGVAFEDLIVAAAAFRALEAA